ncbi:response regulator [Sphingomonas yunnanensis]|uniref:MHYT domain-containing protein n=1 Tax=Sphingomonas yunnanensis TaxID=310400 RepID=UPI001CA6B3C0|nr:MHYT domain-containing protein [Sphingomonas yunnanensis]MBY9062530.1 response regulator [Sphingomonas yunnanensis]
MGAHDGVLVAMSVLVAMFASYTALDLGGRVRAASGRARHMWLITAAIAMGGGIWSMHFLAMLAHSVPGLEVTYDLTLTGASLLVAIVVTGLAFTLMDRAHPSRRRLAVAGLLMGLGVVTMHYMGMAAMRMAADLRYDRLWIAASVLIAIGAAATALWLASRDSSQVKRIAAAVVMGIAVSGMHFAGMRAASFAVHRGAIDPRTSVGQTGLALAVFAATFVILFLSLVAAMFDRRFAQLAEREAAALRSSEERFRALYRGTPLPLHSLDPDGRLGQVSDAWLTLLGYERGEVLGRPLTDFMAAESANRFAGADWARLLATDVLETREYEMVARDGAVLDMLSDARVERSDAGAVARVLGGLTNVTDRKRAEAALRQAQKNEAIGHLTGGVAHDFNNLLAVIIGNLDMLSRRMPEDPRISRLVTNALEAADRGAALTQRLLAFARRQNLRPEATDIPNLVRGMTDLLQRSLGPRVRLSTHFPPDLPAVLVDAHQLELALLNVAVNARDAIPGGGTIEVRASPVDVPPTSVVGLAPGRFVRLSISDDGIGMDEATLARATDPFFTTKEVGKGTGLGLSMVHGLAAQSGGQLVITSRLTAGTTVDLYLPATRMSDMAALTCEEPSCAEPGAAMTILVVDDEPLVLENTAALLEELGHTVRLAASGPIALAQMEAGLRVDVLVTDQMMPGMTGTLVAQRARLLQPGLKVLIVSGYAEIGDREKLRFPLLQKPFDRSALARAVRQLVAGESAARAADRAERWAGYRGGTQPQSIS